MPVFRETALALVLALGPWSASGQGMQIPKPTAGLRTDLDAGKKLFEAACSRCHGVDLRGSKEGPSLLHRIYAPSHHSDVAFQVAVRHGSRQHHWSFGDMQPVPGLTADDVAHITAYVRAEQQKAWSKR